MYPIIINYIIIIEFPVIQFVNVCKFLVDYIRCYVDCNLLKQKDKKKNNKSITILKIITNLIVFSLFHTLISLFFNSNCLHQNFSKL